MRAKSPAGGDKIDQLPIFTMLIVRILRAFTDCIGSEKKEMLPLAFYSPLLFLAQVTVLKFASHSKHLALTKLKGFVFPSFLKQFSMDLL